MRLTEKSVAALKPGPARRVAWDDRLAGFGVRIAPTGGKTYVVKTRVGARQAMITIGTVDETLTIDMARQRAADAIRDARDGKDPQAAKREAKVAMTVAELCDSYMEAARAGLVLTRFHRPKSPATVAIDEGRIARHIKPLIGSVVAKALTTADVQRMSDAIAQGKTAGVFKTVSRGKAVVTGGAGTAARVVELLGGVWSWGRKRGHVAGVSPTGDVDRMRGHPKDRVLNADELAALGKVLDDSTAALALRLIALTGWRREEVCGLRWSEIDGQTARLTDTKDQSRRVSMRPIGQAALEALALVPRIEGSEFVFPSRTGKSSADLKAGIAKLFDKAALGGKDEKSQALRRTFASIAGDMGYSDATIDVITGHARRGVTERHYVRRSDPVLIAAADAVAARIGREMAGVGATVIPLHRAG
jgi:integrase